MRRNGRRPNDRVQAPARPASGSAQRGCAYRQRVRKRHPEVAGWGLEFHPGAGRRSLRIDDGNGTARRQQRPRIGMQRRSGNLSTGPISTKPPRYITAIRWLIWETTDEIMGDENIGQAKFELQLREQVDHLGRIDMSSAATASSQTISFGRIVSTRAMSSRCFCPPDSSCGYRSAIS